MLWRWWQVEGPALAKQLPRCLPAWVLTLPLRPGTVEMHSHCSWESRRVLSEERTSWKRHLWKFRRRREGYARASSWMWRTLRWSRRPWTTSLQGNRLVNCFRRDIGRTSLKLDIDQAAHANNLLPKQKYFQNYIGYPIFSTKKVSGHNTVTFKCICLLFQNFSGSSSIGFCVDSTFERIVFETKTKLHMRSEGIEKLVWNIKIQEPHFVPYPLLMKNCNWKQLLALG